MAILIARFQSGDEFLQRYLEESPNGGLFHPTRKAQEVGDSILLDIRMPLLKDSMLIRGTVAWRQRGKRATGQPVTGQLAAPTAQRAGLGVTFLSSEVGKRDHLLALCRGEVEPTEAQRKHRRLPIALPVQWRVPNQVENHQGSLDDIGTGGVFIRTTAAPLEGSALVLELASPGRPGSQSIEGRVAWTSSKPGSEGIGVEFRCRDIGGMRRLRELIRRIEHSAAVVA
jgi:Tfp pilus assembly protein PilZ